jgi:hypothetical protein
MTYSNKISGFGEWIIPSGEGVTYFEGAPTDEERVLNHEQTAIRRKNWNPSVKALGIFGQLVMLQGSWVKIQLWDEFMLWDVDEGSNPFECNLLKVYVKNVSQKDRDFLQLFIEFKEFKIIDMGYLGGSPIYERNFDSKTGIYTYNCSTFDSVTKK